MDEDSTDVLDLLNTDDEKDEEDNGEEEEEDMDADSIFLRMDDDDDGDEKIAEEKVKESSNYNNNTSSSNKSNAKKKSVCNNNIESSKDETTSNSPGSFQDKLLRQGLCRCFSPKLLSLCSFFKFFCKHVNTYLVGFIYTFLLSCVSLSSCNIYRYTSPYIFLVNKTDETLPKTGVVKLVQI